MRRLRGLFLLILLLCSGPALAGIGHWGMDQDIYKEYPDPAFLTESDFVNGNLYTWPEAGRADGWSAASDLFVLIMSNPAVNGEETASGGGLSGADLIATPGGDLAGAIGGFRHLDGTDDSFNCTQAALEALLTGEDKWSIVVRAKTATTNAGIMLQFYDSGNGTNVNIQDWGNSTIRFYCDDSDTAGEAKEASGLISDDAEYYFFMGCDGSSTRAGFAPINTGSGQNGKPIYWSDFDTANRVTFTNNYKNLGTFATRQMIGTNSASFFEFYMKYMVISSGRCLIDFDM